MDLSMPGRGLALLNDSKYGFSCLGGVMGMSLLRAPTHPDPTADRHAHAFTYSMLPHAGDWVVADVLAQAEGLNRPLRVIGTTDGAGKPVSLIADFGSSGAGDVVLSGISSRERKVVHVRLYEATGADAAAEFVWNVPVKRVRAVDFLGNAIKEPRVAHRKDVTRVEIAAFKIVTLEATLA
jgi:alpha-mannosidase